MNWYPDGVRTKQFPDWYFTFAEFWKSAARFPVEDSHVVPAGFPYHDVMMKAYPREGWKHDKDTVIILSSRKYGDKLSELAVELKKQRPSLKIIYKLHPREIDGWKEKYQSLAQSDIEVIDEVTTPLYSLFARSSMQIGVESTAVYEGMSFELDTYIWDIPQAAPMKVLCEQGFAREFTDAEEFIKLIDDEEGKLKYGAGQFWAENSMSNIVDKIKEILTESKTNG